MSRISTGNERHDGCGFKNASGWFDLKLKPLSRYKNGPDETSTVIVISRKYRVQKYREHNVPVLVGSKKWFRKNIP